MSKSLQIQKQWLENPLISILVIRLISTIIFGVFYSSILLVLMTEFSFKAPKAIGLTGMFFGFHYVLPILGGLLGDKLIDFKRLFLCGKLFQIIGISSLLIAIKDISFLYIGLGCCLVDSLANSVSINMIFTKACEKNLNTGRLVVFMRSQIWTNCGFLIAFFISGIFFSSGNMHTLIKLCLILSASTLIIAFKMLPQYESRIQHSETQVKPVLITICIMTFLAAALSLLFVYSSLSKKFIIIIFSIGSLLLLILSLRGLHLGQKKNILLFFSLISSSLAFWCIYMLGPTFLPLFIKNTVNRNIFGLELPPQWLQVTGPAVEILIGCFITRWLSIYSKSSQSVKKSFMPQISGLIYATVALVALICGLTLTKTTNELQIHWIFLFITFLALGETLLSPANFSMVGELVPAHLQGRLTGMVQLAVGVSVIIASVISESYLPDMKLVTYTWPDQYIFVFGIMGTISVTVAALLKICEKSVSK